MPSSDSSGSNTRDGDSIKVYVRVRPPCAEFQQDQTCLDTDVTKNIVTLKTKPEPKIFTYDAVSDIYTSQDDVFNSVGKILIESCVSGYNGTIFAYGQTGSGKTYTMLGPAEEVDNFQHESRGVIPRSFEYLFNLIKREQEMAGDMKQFLCKCSFLEIYNEQIFDLLDPASPNLSLRENIKKGVFVEGITEQAVSSAVDAYQVLDSGWINRRVASTSMNRESSRSHAVFTLQIESKETKGGVQNVRTSMLNLVDLAGSERQKDTHTVGARLKEAGNINKSLSVLGNVITALVDITNGRNKNKFVPYRDSKLSFLLRDSLGGNAKTCIIACVHPGSKCFGETLSTLQFVRRAKMIKNKAVLNEDTQGNIAQLQAELKRLKEMLQEVTKGTLTPEMIAGKTEACDSSSSNTDGEQAAQYHFKKSFVDAMFFREKAELERKACEDKLKKLNDLLNKKEKVLQSTKMVVKFRERTISILEKKQAGSAETADDKDNLIADLRKEVELLQKQLEHHGGLAKLQVENEALKLQVTQLRTQPPHTVSNQRITELQQTLLQLNAQNEEKKTAYTPQQTGQATPASATVERLKAQVEQYKTEAERAQTALEEQKHVTEKELIALRAQVTAAEKAKQELESMLQASQTRSRIERSTLNDMHMQTIKVMTTPVKSSYNLRSRFINGTPRGSDGSWPCHSDSSLPSLDLSVQDLESGILEEEQPDNMKEEMQAALTEEIHKLQKENGELRQQMQIQSENLRKITEKHDQLVLQLEELDKILERERADRREKDELISTQTSQLTELTTECAELKEKCSDLNVVLNSADKELKTLKIDKKEQIDALKKEVSKLETKIMQVEFALQQSEREQDSLLKEKEKIQEVLEVQEATLRFREEEMKKVEERLEEEKSTSHKLQQDLQLSVQKIEELEAQHQKLVTNMQTDGLAKEKQILGYLCEIQGTRDHINVLVGQMKTQKDEIDELCEKLESATSSVTRLEKEKSQDQDVISGLLSRIHQYKSTVQEMEGQLASKSAELSDSSQQVAALQSDKEDLKVAVNQLKSQIDQYAVQLEEQEMTMVSVKVEHEYDLQRLQAMMDSIQENADIVKVGYEEVCQIKEELELSNVETKKQLEESEQMIGSLEMENRELQHRCAALDTLVKEVQDQLQDPDSHVETDKDCFASVRAEVERHLKDKRELNSLLEQFEKSRQESYDQITHLQENIKDKEHKIVCIEKYMENLQNEVTNMKAELQKSELEKESAYQKCSEAENVVKTAEDKASKAEMHLADQTDANNKLALKLSEVEKDLLSKQGEIEDKEQEVIRLRQVVSQYHSQVDEVKSELQHINQEKKGLEKDRDDLMKENSALLGHQNHKQKIHYVENLKSENVQLRTETTQLKETIHLLRTQNSLYKSSLKESTLNSEGKENCPLVPHNVL